MSRILKTRNISVAFGDKIVLNDVTADFEAGVMTAIIGSNGVGKTTYLKAIAHLTRSGEAQIWKRTALPPSTRRRSPMCLSWEIFRPD